ADTDRPNVRYKVHATNGSIECCYEGLEAFMDFKKTVVYFDGVEELTTACQYLWAKALASEKQTLRQDQIATYYAAFAPETKQLYMAKFKRGDICMLLSTEAAGMGCDISDILRVV
ncbi:hypothetical protein BGZ73_000598, partial [Actinomortierella ambigua]